MTDIMKRNLLKAAGLGVLSGCATAAPAGRSVSIVKFNYTDRYIGDVSVNGVWAAGVDAFGGGGDRIQGLMAPSNTTSEATLKIGWAVGSIYSVADDEYTRMPIQAKTASVEVARPYPANPTYLVLHFYPDGHIEAELEADRPKRRIPPPPGYHR
ncbi:DUF3304 domain-containing protein [Salinibacterium sp.]|uniref:DUF3304 domain-containing protein n=1 Tax=Salinibacterium sp. TaxID=1915057 RepID=UPI00286C2989|nr:DUF3304 domain-containing protein [Salinibacterium sp.]